MLKNHRQIKSEVPVFEHNMGLANRNNHSMVEDCNEVNQQGSMLDLIKNGGQKDWFQEIQAKRKWQQKQQIDHLSNHNILYNS